jgi:hypothetical protein
MRMLNSPSSESHLFGGFVQADSVRDVKNVQVGTIVKKSFFPMLRATVFPGPKTRKVYTNAPRYRSNLVRSSELRNIDGSTLINHLSADARGAFLQREMGVTLDLASTATFTLSGAATIRLRELIAAGPVPALTKGKVDAGDERIQLIVPEMVGSDDDGYGSSAEDNAKLPQVGDSEDSDDEWTPPKKPSKKFALSRVVEDEEDSEDEQPKLKKHKTSSK